MDVIIYMFLFFIEGLYFQVKGKVVVIWCFKDCEGVWLLLMQKGVVFQVQNCMNLVDCNIVLVQCFGINGMFMLIVVDGCKLLGVVFVEWIVQWFDVGKGVV